jgi:universal stress protein E
MRLERIVVGVATAEPADPVLGPALDLASTLRAELHVVHALPDGDSTRSWGGAQAREQVRSTLENGLRELAAASSTRLHVIDGAPHRVLAAEASRLGADLLVTGPTRRGAVARTVLGSTAQHVLRQCGVPVLVLRRHLPRLSPRVLLTTDLSTLSEQVHLFGAEIARRLAAPSEPRCMSVCVSPESPRPLDGMRANENTQLEADFARFLDVYTPPAGNVEPCVRRGDPAAEILILADEWQADLAVVGSHARRGAARLLLGSVAEAVIRGASCNVLVVPASSIRETMLLGEEVAGSPQQRIHAAATRERV